MKKTIFYTIVILTVISTVLISKSFRVSEIPNGAEFGCANCHVSPAGGGARNAFGLTVEGSYLDGGGHVIWNAELANMDPDRDGFTNGEELQDPNGIWTSGDIGDPSLVTNPGDPSSFPDPTSILDREIPTKFKLMQNYPNPFNPSTIISYYLEESGFVNLTVYNSNGEEVSSLVNKNQNAGLYNVQFKTTDLNLSSGIYFYRIKSGNFTATNKMILMK